MDRLEERMPGRREDISGCVSVDTGMPAWEIREDHPEEVTNESRANPVTG